MSQTLNMSIGHHPDRGCALRAIGIRLVAKVKDEGDQAFADAIYLVELAASFDAGVYQHASIAAEARTIDFAPSFDTGNRRRSARYRARQRGASWMLRLVLRLRDLMRGAA